MAVGMGDAVEARAIVQQYAPNIMCMIDQNQQTYQQFGVGRAGLGAFFVLILFSYTKTDPAWSHASLVPKIGNLGGDK